MRGATYICDGALRKKGGVLLMFGNEHHDFNTKLSRNGKKAYFNCEFSKGIHSVYLKSGKLRGRKSITRCMHIKNTQTFTKQDKVSDRKRNQNARSD